MWPPLPVAGVVVVVLVHAARVRIASAAAAVMAVVCVWWGGSGAVRRWLASWFLGSGKAGKCGLVSWVQVWAPIWMASQGLPSGGV